MEAQVLTRVRRREASETTFVCYVSVSSGKAASHDVLPVAKRASSVRRNRGVGFIA